MKNGIGIGAPQASQSAALDGVHDLSAATDEGAIAASSEVSEWRRGWPVVLAANIGFGCSLAMFAMSGGSS